MDYLVNSFVVPLSSFFSFPLKKKNNDKIAMQLRYYDDFQAYDDRLEIVEGVFKRGTVSVSRMGEKAGSSTS